jgi:hypothetical protein
MTYASPPHHTAPWEVIFDPEAVMRRSILLPLILSISFASRVAAQIPMFPAAPLPTPIPHPAPILSTDDRSGPRLGMAYIAGGSVTAENEGKTMTPLTSVFGWQIEHQFPTGEKDMPMPVTELVTLVGGMEQGLFLPSLTFLAGMRKPNGWEAGIGPSLTGAGVQLAAAVGITRSIGNLNVPFNFAVAPGRRGAAISITTGFNTSPR